jgi:hypothetical protein
MNFPTYNGMQNPGIYPQPQPVPNYAPNPTPSPLMNQNMAQSPFNWVQGEAGAKAYPVAPNAVVELWDSESDTIYIKSADRTGMPSIKVLDYRVRNEAHNGSNSVLNTSSEEIITRKDLEELRGEIETLKGQIAKMKPCKCSNESHKRENNLVKGGNGGNKR